MLVSLVTWAVFGFFVIAWGFVLVPPALRLLGGVIRPSDTIGSFQQKMSVLGGARPVGPPQVITLDELEPAAAHVLDLRDHRPQPQHGAATPLRSASTGRARAARRRRRNIFSGLAASSGVTLLLALAAGGAAWLLFLLCAALFGSYTTLLWQLQRNALERADKVAYLPASRGERVLVLQQAGGTGR